MISKKKYVEQQVESSWEDHKYINQILINYFNDEVKDMTNEEFAEHLKDLNWEIGE